MREEIHAIFVAMPDERGKRLSNSVASFTLLLQRVVYKRSRCWNILHTQSIP
jgi:hypothetical protein